MVHLVWLREEKRLEFVELRGQQGKSVMGVRAGKRSKEVVELGGKGEKERERER